MRALRVSRGSRRGGCVHCARVGVAGSLAPGAGWELQMQGLVRSARHLPWLTQKATLLWCVFCVPSCVTQCCTAVAVRPACEPADQRHPVRPSS